MIYFTEISDFVFPWTTWNTRGLSFAVWITHWISLLLLTERHSTERQLRHKTEMTHLRQFLLQRLENDSLSSIISWSRKDRREFKLRNPKKMAQRWGIFKRNKAMTYKKLSRALQCYYQLGNIKTVSQYISLCLHGRWYSALIFKLNCSRLNRKIQVSTLQVKLLSLYILIFFRKQIVDIPSWLQQQTVLTGIF